MSESNNTPASKHTRPSSKAREAGDEHIHAKYDPSLAVKDTALEIDGTSKHLETLQSYLDQGWLYHACIDFGANKKIIIVRKWIDIAP